MTNPDYTAMSAPELLAACRDDAAKWAAAFCQHAARQGLTIDEGWMIGWFANAIEHSHAVRGWRAPDAAEEEMLAALKLAKEYLVPAQWDHESNVRGCREAERAVKAAIAKADPRS